MSSMKLTVVSSIIIALLIISMTNALDCQCQNLDGTLGFVGPFSGSFTPFLQCYYTGEPCSYVYDAVVESGELDCCTCCCGANSNPAEFHGVTDHFETTDGCPLSAPGGD